MLCSYSVFLVTICAVILYEESASDAIMLHLLRCKINLKNEACLVFFKLALTNLLFF